MVTSADEATETKLVAGIVACVAASIELTTLDIIGEVLCAEMPKTDKSNPARTKGRDLVIILYT